MGEIRRRFRANFPQLSAQSHHASRALDETAFFTVKGLNVYFARGPKANLKEKRSEGCE
jgi:hypothetical protein